MFSALLSSGLSLETNVPPCSMYLLSNQKLDENTVKHRSNLFHWVSSCIYVTFIQQFCWLLDTSVVNELENFISKAEASNVFQLSWLLDTSVVNELENFISKAEASNVFQLSAHTCLIFFVRLLFLILAYAASSHHCTLRMVW